MWSTPPLLSPSGLLCPEVVVSDRVLSMGQIIMIMGLHLK